MSIRRTVALIVLAGIAVPLFASAQTDVTAEVAFSDPFVFRRQGIFGCSIDGSYSMSVGALSAVGGVYVPVNDAAVTLNTGYLVYKECVLRGVVNRQREATTAETARKIIVDYRSARDGNPLYSQLLPREEKEIMNEYVLDTLRGSTLNSLNAQVKDPVARAIAFRYVQSVNTPGSVFSCQYAGDLRTVYSGRPTGSAIGAIGTLSTPCNPLIAYGYANEVVLGGAEAAAENLRTKLGWANGNYPAEVRDADGNYITVTPGYLVAANVTQAVQTGFRQQENANDIDQMVGALFAGMAAQVIGDNRGLAGLTQTTGSQPSYLDQVVREAATGLRNAATNAALQILSGKKSIEESFNRIMRSIASVLNSTINGLRTRERQCWELIIERVCTTSPDSNKRCTATSGDRLQIATSTVQSQRVVNARIASLATSTLSNIDQSDRALEAINRLIAGVTNSSSLDAQRVALQQLDNLVAQRALHSEADVTQAQRTQETVTSSMETLVTDTVREWTESTNPNVGWCNVTNDAVLEKWIDEWKI